MQKSIILSRIGAASFAAALLSVATHAWSQSSDTFSPAPSPAPLTAERLETLVGPVALYADDLIGIVLPASTYPLQIVQASRFLDQLAADATLQPDPEWDSSIVALLNYPQILRMMDANIEWTWELGEAVLDAQAAVMDAIQLFRREAVQAGNLASNSQQTVTDSGNLIEIAPADPEVIYIPYYEPERVVVVQPQPVVHYYSDPYPVYYYPYPVSHRFRSGFFWGVTSAFHIGWHSHSLHVYHHLNNLHPYYGRSYYTPWYSRRGVNININVNRTNSVWRSRSYRAARPTRTVNRTRVTVNREGLSNTGRTRTQSGTRTQVRTNVSRNTQRNTASNTTALNSRTAQQPTTRRSTTARQSTTRQPTTRQSATGTRQTTTRPPTFGSSRGSASSGTRQRSTRTTPQTRTQQRVPTFASPQRESSNTSRARTTTRTPSVQSRQSGSQPRVFSGSTRSTRTPSGASRSTSSRSSGSATRSSSSRSSGGSTRSSSTRQNGRTRR